MRRKLQKVRDYLGIAVIMVILLVIFSEYIPEVVVVCGFFYILSLGGKKFKKGGKRS